MAKNGMRVGIDLQQASIAGAQVKGVRQNNTLTNVAVRALPEGLVFEGEVVDVDGLAAELKSFWKDSGFTGKKFSLGVANQKIVVRTMEFPLIDEKELRAAIEFQAQEAIPIPMEDAILDFEVLSTDAADDGGGRQKVLIVAAQRDMITHVHAGGAEGRPQHRRHRPAGLRAHALGGAVGALGRPGRAGRRRDGARQHRLRRHEPRRGPQRRAAVHARRQHRLRRHGAGPHAPPRHRLRRGRHPASQRRRHGLRPGGGRPRAEHHRRRSTT